MDSDDAVDVLNELDEDEIKIVKAINLVNENSEYSKYKVISLTEGVKLDKSEDVLVDNIKEEDINTKDIAQSKNYNKSEEVSQEIMEEIVSLLHCYSMKLYSKRRVQKIKEAIEDEEA